MSQDSQPKKTEITYGRDQVVEIINSVLSKIQEPRTLPHDEISHELVTLKDAIVDLRQQLNAVQPGSIGQTDIPTAKEELNAVVGATEHATTTIMDCCENILAQIQSASTELIQMTEAEIVKIYEACTFQDITGQRISKVLKTLIKIDEQVLALLSTLDTQLVSLGHTTQVAQAQDDSQLLNGPQLPENAVSQEEIDRILASFEN